MGSSDKAIAPTTILVLKRVPGQDQAEDEERSGDKAGDGIEGNHFAPRLRLERNIERAHGEDGGKKKRDEDAAEDELDAEFVASGTHAQASGGVGRNWRRAQLEQIAARAWQ